MHKKLLTLLLAAAFLIGAKAQNYPKGYFRPPLNIPMALVANFGEIRPNHWHMGLDVRTQQRENLPVYASAEGYVSRIGVEPGGFGQAIYITHPNGFTTLYAHMNGFFPALQQKVKEEQYRRQSWKISLEFSPAEFPLAKGDYIGLSGNTGGSAGPHVHFEIRDAKTEKVLNPLLFGFPIPDAVRPSVVRLAMYDRNRSTYLQAPQLLNIAQTKGRLIKVGTNRISFAVGATDRFTGSANPNGIYAATVYADEQPVSSFTLDNIGYDETRYINAQIDFPFAARGGSSLQHLSPLPGAATVPYNTYGGDGVIELFGNRPQTVFIEVLDAARNATEISFQVQYDPSLAKAATPFAGERFLPGQINVFEKENNQSSQDGGFQVTTTERTIYDTINLTYTIVNNSAAGSISPQHNFLTPAIPFHDSVTVRIKPTTPVDEADRDRIVIKNVSGSRSFVQKATWQQGWLMAKFRQPGGCQAFVDNRPPVINAVPADLSKAKRIVFTPTDDFSVIKNFRVELDGQWLRFTNDKGKTWIYKFDEKFPPGLHELKAIAEDEAGNVAEKVWQVRR